MNNRETVPAIGRNRILAWKQPQNRCMHTPVPLQLFNPILNVQLPKCSTQRTNRNMFDFANVRFATSIITRWIGAFITLKARLRRNKVATRSD